MNRLAVPRFLLLCLLLVSTGLAMMPAGSTAAQDSSAPATSPEQQLAELFAPIVMIKKQDEECSTKGEQFRPVVVDILFGTDDVRLMKRGSGGVRTDIEIKRNIQASDLYGLDDQYYLDLPGNSRDPECVYEKWGKKRMAALGLQPSLYARVTTDASSGKVVLQFWYYWIFNRFNNTHESDWEGIQLIFDAESAQQILDQNLLPSTIAFAQHEGGEQADWNDDKVETQDTHIVSHPSSGSHADYYESAVWLGWGENGSGFGCDYSDDPDEELPVEIVMLPSGIPDANSDFAWLTYTGRWGERDSQSMFSGPTGPNTKPRWDEPVTWNENIRGNSLPVPVEPTIGPAISQVFCGAAEFGSRLVRVFPIDPKVVGALGFAAVLGLLALAAMAWHWIWQAIRLYVKHAYFFVTVGVLSFPIAYAGQILENRLQSLWVTQLDETLRTKTVSRGIYTYILHTGLGGVQEIVLACMIGPIVIYATRELTRGDFPGFERTWKHGVRDFPKVLLATFYVATLLSFMSITIVLLPLAIYKGIRWFFTPEAVVVEGASWTGARHVSSDRLRGHWFRAAAVVVAVAALSGLPGPLVGTVGLVLDFFSLGQAQWVSGAIYCVLYPIAIMTATLFYISLTRAPGFAKPYIEPRQVSDTSVAPSTA